MRGLIIAVELATGFAYTGLGVLSAFEMMRQRSTLGRSQFGLSFMFMAFTCGPHHLAMALATFGSHRQPTGPELLALVIGMIPGVIFVALRVEALLGGPGDRALWFSAAFLPATTALIGVVGGGVVVTMYRGASQIDRPLLLVNAVLGTSYLMVGWYIIATQLRRFGAPDYWSLSGVSLGLIFPTCALGHAVHVLAVTHHATAGWPRTLIVAIDIVGLPASIWFLTVVRRLYHEALSDWNRRPLVGLGASPNRLAPWDAR